MGLSILVLALGALLFVGIFFAGYALSGKLGALEKRLRQFRPHERGLRATWRSYVTRFPALVGRLGKLIPRSTKEMSRQEKRLVEAGIRGKDARLIFLGSQACLAATTFVILSLSGQAQRNFLLCVALSIFLGALLPDFWLMMKARKRKDRIQLALPDALDLEVVSVEAGLSLDQSLMRVGREIHRSHPELSDELHILNLELNAGKSRAEALRNLGRRTGVDDLRALTAVLIQTDRFGTSIADALRVYSDAFRAKRKQRAEEHAAKMGVKMVLPLFLFILPATFIVIVGPAVIQIAKGLLPMLRVPGP